MIRAVVLQQASDHLKILVVHGPATGMQWGRARVRSGYVGNVGFRPPA